MGSSDSRNLSETNEKNNYIPNLIAKEIIGEENEKKIDKNKMEKKKLIEEKNDNKLNNEKLLNLENNNYLNRNNEFDDLNNENRLNDNEWIKRDKGRQYNKNLFVAHTAEAIKMEITNQKKDLDYRKFKFNGITVVQNLKDYIPANITKEEIKDMIYNAFGEGLVDEFKNYIPGKTVTRQQANAIIDLVEGYIKNDSNIENLEKNDILNDVNLIIDLVDLNREIIKEKMFKGKNPSDIQIENLLKNLSQGQENVKILSIEFQ